MLGEFFYIGAGHCRIDDGDTNLVFRDCLLGLSKRIRVANIVHAAG